MWNPLALPLAAVAVAAELPRAIASLSRATDLMAEGVERLERLNEQGDAMLEEVHRARELVERLMSGGDELVAAADRANAQADRLIESTEPVLEAMRRAQPSAERLAEFAEPILEASISARDQLRETQAELATANERVARALELAAPLESMADRVERITGRLGRDPD
jgi:methyl-accepting chemotaxis protein